MTDITDQDRRTAHEWAASLDPDMKCWSDRERAAARVILATVDAPAPTLAEELQDMLEARDREDQTSFSGLLARVEQVEQERNSLEQQRDYWCDSERQAVKDRYHLAAEIDKANTDILHLTAERDDARAEVKVLAEDLAGAESEVERLTAVNENLRRTDNYREFKEFLGVQKAAESNAETPNPADVPPGEAWEVIATDPVKMFGGTTSHNTVAFRMTDRWIVCRQGYQTPLVVPDDCIRLVRRHVPAPRVITNPDELERAKRGTVIRDAAGVVCERDPMGDDWSTFANLTDQTPYIEFPATVLWEPEA